MGNFKLKEAREKYKKGKITFFQLNDIFHEVATEEEMKEFSQAPVFDRQWVVEGYNKKERDNMFDEFWTETK